MASKRTGLTFDAVAGLAGELPEVEVAESHRTRALRVRGKLMARIWEDGVTLVLRLPFVVRDHLMRTEPSRYFLTDHYHDYPYVLVDLRSVDAADLRPLLEESWVQVAPKRLVAARVRANAGAAPTAGRRRAT
ncbi:MAG: MmcQ/YjbR family DNA-binding protein [Chloroflexota bacterium]|nr:MmcQ/YjbR family DNA-binding protein [Chloroflexota bacterium]